jgi:hypothetical protein
MNLIDCLLTPSDLYLAEDESSTRLAIMGTCVAEHLVNAGASKNLLVDHYLLETWTNAPVPDIHTNELDGIIIHLTLRHILDMASGIGFGDVSYINSPIDELSHKSEEILIKRIDSIVEHYAREKPVFFFPLLNLLRLPRVFSMIIVLTVSIVLYAI